MKALSQVLFNRTAWLTIAAAQAVCLGAIAGLGLLITLHLVPSDPSPDTESQSNYGPWHASIEELLFALGFAVAALPGTLAVLALTKNNIPHRRMVLTVSMALVAILWSGIAWFFATGADAV
jgi:Ni/Fe-hydrogenase subunit HybB-like protein